MRTQNKFIFSQIYDLIILSLVSNKTWTFARSGKINISRGKDLQRGKGKKKECAAKDLSLALLQLAIKEHQQ